RSTHAAIPMSNVGPRSTICSPVFDGTLRRPTRWFVGEAPTGAGGAARGQATRSVTPVLPTTPMLEEGGRSRDSGSARFRQLDVFGSDGSSVIVDLARVSTSMRWTIALPR